MATTPNLGYGNQNSADINTVNQWMRSQPWYQSLLKSFGQDPNNVHLNDSQKASVVKAAQANGVIVDEGHNGQEVDDSGNFQPKSDLGRKIAIGAAIGGLALTGIGAAGIGPLAGVLGAGGAAAEGGAAAAGAGAGAAGAGAGAAGLAGVEGGAYGLGDAALGALGTGAMGATGVGAGAAAGAGGAFDAAGNFIGDSTYGGAAAGGGSSILDTAGKIGSALTSAAAARASGRGQEANINQNQDRNAIGLYTAENAANTAENNFGLNRGELANRNAATDLSQRNFALTAPAARAGNAVRGDILSRAQDVSFSGLPKGINPPTISGGLRPSMFSPATRALGANVTSSALDAQQKGDTFAPLPDLPTYKAGPTPPTLTGIPQANGLDTGLNVGGSLLSLAPTFAQLLKQYGGSA